MGGTNHASAPERETGQDRHPRGKLPAVCAHRFAHWRLHADYQTLEKVAQSSGRKLCLLAFCAAIRHIVLAACHTWLGLGGLQTQAERRRVGTWQVSDKVVHSACVDSGRGIRHLPGRIPY